MIILAVIIPIIIGYLILRLLLHNKQQLISWPEKIAIGYLFGTTLITLQMFLYALIGIKFSALGIGLPWLLLLGTLAVRDTDKLNFKLKDLNPLDLLLSGLILAKVIYVFMKALIRPVLSWDAIWNFSLKSKIFYFIRTVPLDRKGPLFMGLGMPQYPLQIPLLESWTYFIMNSWNDQMMKILFPLYFCALLIIFYYTIRKYQPRTHSLFFTLLLSTLPLLVAHATLAYTDLVVSTYFLGAVAYLYRYIQSKERPFLFISAFLIGASGWVKEEGVIFYLFILITLVLYERIKGWKNIAAYSLPMFIFTFPWMLIKKVLGLSVGNLPRFTLDRPTEFFFWKPEMLTRVAERTFMVGSWHIFPVIFLVFLVFYFRNIILTNKRYILFIFMLTLTFFLSLYVFTYNWEYIVLDTILGRNYLTYMPIAMLLMALTFSFSRKENK